MGILRATGLLTLILFTGFGGTAVIMRLRVGLWALSKFSGMVIVWLGPGSQIRINTK